MVTMRFLTQYRIAGKKWLILLAGFSLLFFACEKKGEVGKVVPLSSVCIIGISNYDSCNLK